MSNTPTKVVVTGAAGFIGSHLSKALLEKGYYVIAIDSLNPYYDIRLKQTHLNQIKSLPQAEKNFHFHHIDINEEDKCKNIFDQEKPTVIVHLAAQAGVRYCQAHPDEAENNNIKTTRLLLDLAHREGSTIKQFLFASSSSIYGTHPRPWKETYETKPEGIYGESKQKGEEMCREIFQKQKVSITAMRFFTVYGPFGRPDMAPGKFMDLIHRGEQIPVYGDGSAIRDFTFVEDIVQGITLIIEHPNFDEFQIYNLGKGTKVPNSVIDLIQCIEKHLDKKANILFTDPMAGDVPATQADISKAENDFGYKPIFELDDGIKKTAKIFFQNTTKFIIVLLYTKNDSSLLVNQFDKLKSQSCIPNLIVLLDQSDDDNYNKNVSVVNDFSDLSVHHMRISNDCSVKDTWSEGFSYLASDSARKLEGFDHKSNGFVSFIYNNDFLSWDNNTFSQFVDLISSNGFEHLTLEQNAKAFSVRADILLHHHSVDSFQNADTNDDFINSLKDKTYHTDNIRRFG